jgi:signal transduction histidine kinase
MIDARATSKADAVQHRLLSEQVALMCRLSASPLFGSTLIAAIMAYLAIEEAGLIVSLAWYCLSLATMLIRWRVAEAFLARPRDYTEVRRWLTAMLTLIVLFGVVWSIPAGFLMPSNPQKEIIMTVMFIGATATGLGSLAAVRHAYALLLVPFTLPYGLHQLLLGGDRLLIGGAFLLYLPVMIVIANRQTDSIERQIRLAIDNEALADALRVERDRANEANRELQTRVEEQRRAAESIRLLNDDLQSQAAELRAVNSDLEGFCYSVSHDLRGPLRAIDGFSHMIEQRMGADSSGESSHYLVRIRENVARMSTLIDDLLEFSRCGRQPIEKTIVPMEALARTAANEARHANDSQASPKITIEELPAAHGDQHMMMQVWVNLIDNAVKYSSKVPAPAIIVRGREERDRTVYEVIDNGVGFDSRYADAMFGVFQRLHRNSEYPGTGVGLAIVHRIITRHGGEVWATSEINRGATFAFALPKSEAPKQLLQQAS